MASHDAVDMEVQYDTDTTQVDSSFEGDNVQAEVEVVAEQNAEVATGSAETLPERQENNNTEAAEEEILPVSSTPIKCSPDNKKSPEAKNKPTYSPGLSDDEGQTCSICFELWTNYGNHRLASLRCGHIFGLSCIKKWLQGKNNKCPQCNSKARRADVRVIYAKAVKVLDTSERDKALQELEKEKEARRKAELETAQIRLNYSLVQNELKALKEEIKQQKQQLLLRNRGSPTKADNQLTQSQSLKILLEKTLEICKDGGCRVLAQCDFLNMILVSQPSTNMLFPGFGIKKINTLDFRAAEYVCVHSKPIRDLTFNPLRNDGLVLTASMDKTVRLTSVLSNSIVQTYNTDIPVWSCIWNLDNPMQFFVGLQNGVVLLYDTRQTSGFVEQLTTSGSFSPVVALQYIGLDPLSSFCHSGLLVGQLDRCTFFEQRGSEYKPHILPVEGPVTSLNYDAASRQFLVTCRPSSKHPNVRHLLGDLTSVSSMSDPTIVDPSISCNIVQTYLGGSTQKLLTRSHLLRHPTNPDIILACAGDETLQGILIWDIQTMNCIKKLSTSLPVVDMTSINVAGKSYLITLSEKMTSFYHWGL